MHRHNLILAGLSLSLAASHLPAHAGVFGEAEPNNTLATAQLVTDPGSLQSVINGARSFADPSDDFFRFAVMFPGTIQITSTSTSLFADSILGLYGPTGSLLASNDDAGPGTSMSAISFEVSAAGLYALGFSGYNPELLSCAGNVTSCYDTNGDFVFDTFVAGGGAGGSTGWAYSVTVSQVAAIPEPQTYALMGAGLALLALVRRRVSAVRRESMGASQ